MNRRDRRVSELEYYFEIGVIDHAYYVATKKELLDSIANKEQVIWDILSETKRWITMSPGQRKRFLIMNVKEIRIDMNNKFIVQIAFKERK